ncbi:hypothetical protein EI983_11605 [Roseovarius faecimaris]|uniref:Uncharacterized protein n=1 Tax=Roseovarius faecimaris TaxID=2494550 RepID=A0A6I6IRM5_9RHOB|nr:hypothetical protein [Roseovarius faecimaris]QGX98882.1 hypothetical protein EI983_11605 [Roseovarius faecimaris]
MEGDEKEFEYTLDGLTYTVTVYELDGAFYADISVIEGAMDANALYYGDDEFSGDSASLNGPLNMNGQGSQYEGETVQWDNAIELSDPGLGSDADSKETYLTEGETLTVPLPISSLDEIDFIGIRATSTTTDEGSIKGVSGDPEEPEEPEDPTYAKVFFTYETDDSGFPVGGFPILSEEPDPNTFDIPALPEGTDPTFENYVNYFEEIGGNVGEVETVIFYSTDEQGDLLEEFRIDAPEGGFQSTDELLAAYDAALEEQESGEESGSEALDLMAAISLSPELENAPVEIEEEDDMVEIEAV